MAKQKFLSGKRLQIDKDKSSLVIIVGIASFVAIFSLVASKSLLSQRAYQSKIIHGKQQALKQLNTNNDEAKKLVDAYKVFIGSPDNIIGGVVGGTGDRDGDNGKIILNALPSKYDFPALVSGLEKILTGKGFRIEGIQGTDDEVNQSKQVLSSSPEPVEIPFTASVSGPSKSIADFINILQLSIRPIKINKITISGSDSDLKIDVISKTYYQPQKVVQTKFEEVK